MTTLIAIFTWLHKHRGLIISLIAALIITILFLVIRIEISKIETLSGQISDLKNQNQALIDQLSTAAEDVKAVRTYLFSLENIAVQERQELTKNEEICENITDFDDIVPRLNELFGYCEPPAAEAGH